MARLTHLSFVSHGKELLDDCACFELYLLYLYGYLIYDDWNLIDCCHVYYQNIESY